MIVVLLDIKFSEVSCNFFPNTKKGILYLVLVSGAVDVVLNLWETGVSRG